ncbi:C2H2 finger domain-containing protein [Colletotrichum karsti]|uniref:C2H2 finger domain-containing protein n=1 Tax=Colletotrichum karsti TaxID=1095194 RepID=A0A9P6I9X7_9PEZI|nr:C2H2 finger domain-containing protein [Colletotrichum karsti]KAF9879018.1 C2H2 finger domain-containing protein [Colletotrichum karsti]
MASTYAVPPASFHDGQANEPRNPSPPTGTQRRLTANSSFDPNHLSPASQFQSSSVSPSFNDTPAESISTFSQYQSDYSDMDDSLDPFFGVDFNSTEPGTPSFLGAGDRTDSFGQTTVAQTLKARNGAQDHSSYPFTPEQTASLHTNSPGSDPRTNATSVPDRLPTSISPQELQKPFQAPYPISTYAVQPALTLQPTPDPSGSGRSSEDGAVPSPGLMAAQSPRVTVSMWGKDDSEPIQSIERTFTPEDEKSSTARGGGVSSAGDLMSSQDQSSFKPSSRRSSFSRRGLDPDNRPSIEIASVNEMVTRREIEEKNQEVDQWLKGSIPAPPQKQDDFRASPEDLTENDRLNRPIPLGNDTENRHQPGQTYFNAGGGEMTATDLHIMHENRVWGDSPVAHPINAPEPGKYQPLSSNDAIARFNRMCMDNESIVSKAATWGTRRRNSLPSLNDVDVENVTSGSILKKLSISRGEGGRRPSILKELRGIVRRPSNTFKRSRSIHEDEPVKSESSPPEKRDSFPTLMAGRTTSWGKQKTPTPSINTALVSIGGAAGSIGATHARTGSISATPITSPKSPFGGLQVRNTLRRPRSKSDLPKGASNETHSNLVGMWRKTGGPPVAALAKTSSTNLDLDDEDDDDEEFEDGEVDSESGKLIDSVTPNFAGFQQHILRLNPDLAHPKNNFLVDRIAHQQVVRYKSLLNARVKHLGIGAACTSGALCQARGGRPTLLDQKGDPRELDPLSSGFDSGDGDSTPIEGAITKDSFPQDIPMPPTQSLPAEFECQLCFTLKKPKKPSDWTKHVHEDVQPFTCTWDKCRDPKIFKRKADWVRHENEGHRHLEWWTCDVEDCRHTCYRRDNFLQHLVREHKFTEPKNKTKAAIKRAGIMDPTWQKVEQCRHETNKRPSDEECRFCGKQFPSWKKLTVHLAKHMEHISLPILRLVAAKELEPDTIISPVQDPPPRNIFNEPISAVSGVKSEPSQGPNYAQPSYQPHTMMGSNNGAFQSMDQFGFTTSNTVNPQFQGYMFGQQYPNNGQPMGQNVMGAQSGRGLNQQYHTNNMAMSGGQYMGTQYMPVASDTEPFPSMDQNALGLQHPPQFGSQMSYDGMLGQSNVNENPYSSQGSISPYSHSPLQGGSGFYPPQ